MKMLYNRWTESQIDYFESVVCTNIALHICGVRFDKQKYRSEIIMVKYFFLNYSKV